MDIATLVGVVSGIILVVSAILINASITNFIDIPSILIVIGGTTASTFNAYPMGSVILALKISIKIFFGHRVDYISTLKEMLKISTLARRKVRWPWKNTKPKTRF